MVQALVDGVKGGKWYSLWDKVIALRTLEAAFAKVKANDGAAGVDHVSVEAFERDKERNLRALHESLKAGTYRPSAIRRCFIPKAGSKELRPLGIPTVRDRVVQTALRAGIEPIFEREFADHSYGFRARRSAHQAIDRVEQQLCAGMSWVVDVDLKSYFDTVPHDALMAKVRTRVADGRVLELIEAFLTQPIAEDGGQWTPTVGTPQGAVVSPVLSNVYLDALDHLMVRAGFEMTRYADDFVIQCRSEEEAKRALAEVTRWCGTAGLTVHPTKTRIVKVSATEGFDFLGYHFRAHRDDPGRVKKWPREKSGMKLRDTLRLLTKRTSGHALEEIIKRVPQCQISCRPVATGWRPPGLTSWGRRTGLDAQVFEGVQVADGAAVDGASRDEREGTLEGGWDLALGALGVVARGGYARRDDARARS